MLIPIAIGVLGTLVYQHLLHPVVVVPVMNKLFKKS